MTGGDFQSKVVRKTREYLGYSESDPETITVSSYIGSKTRAAGPVGRDYLKSLFPFIQWAPRYNFTWLYGDLVAGITVGMVLVPQSLSYAKLALLQPEYGLYSSFIGVLTYAFFATSKDVSIGPVAVMSLETGNIIAKVQEKFGDLYSAPQIAVCLAFICGFIVLAIGLLRIGFIVEFIPQPAVSGFMTGSAINIAAGQIPAVFGLAKRLDTRAATYKVIINTLKNLPHTSLDAAFGLTALAFLYGVKWTLTYLPKRYPKFARPAFFLMALRHAVMIIVFTIASWRINVHEKKPRIALVGYVPSGLRHVGQPYITGQLLGALGPHLPVATIILLLEHISIAKSFGRLNGYKINPNQELIAIGVNNTLGSVFSAYPSTGSFSRSALKAKSGVRTPAAGIPTGIVVLVALYAVAPAFYWIPNAALSALIIHAVADLVTPLKQSIGFWRVSPFEYLIFVGAVLWSIFYSIEAGIYWSLASSAALLLVRIARPKGHFLGRVRVQPENPELGTVRDVFVPLDNEGGMTNQGVVVEPPPPGIIIYRFEESFLYPNASHINDRIIEHVKATTRHGKHLDGVSKGDRPWNDPAPSKAQAEKDRQLNGQKPRLRAVILDFAAVANLDTTGVQNLIDTRREVEKWADRKVEFHFTGILSPWIRRALVAGGFGTGESSSKHMIEVAPVVPRDDSNFPTTESSDSQQSSPAESFKDISYSPEPKPSAELAKSDSEETPRRSTGVSLLDRATPFFHFDLADALQSIEA
ncbi:sulfate transporter family-domain-containing protein [Kockovaella imperatae]|uniref:Sulfate transporter family-domain-containing protein n=1 Tax=Kockovaella imperatae TaxID=4999 RepID=A0A1Y1UFH1_9TREE|nr:sulfate transporter family-domain-containing protein [Kockovaella imperatae]ORX36803.1 sulfate transporter family-domain-containing protein [Kockovaella imperatae]